MTTEKTKEELRGALREWLVAFNSRDGEKFFNLFHPEAIYANDGSPLMRGVDEIKPWYEEAWRTLTSRALFKEEAVVAGTDMGFVIGKFYFEPAEKDAPVGETGRVAVIYRRNEEGRWLLSLDIDNRPPDVLPEDFSAAGESAYLS